MLDYDSILQYLKEYNFAGYSMILSDSNYWNYASTTILFDYEMLNEEVHAEVFREEPFTMAQEVQINEK